MSIFNKSENITLKKIFILFYNNYIVLNNKKKSFYKNYFLILKNWFYRLKKGSFDFLYMDFVTSFVKKFKNYYKNITRILRQKELKLINLLKGDFLVNGNFILPSVWHRLFLLYDLENFTVLSFELLIKVVKLKIKLIDQIFYEKKNINIV